MDNLNIVLHSQAKDLLFKYFKSVLKIFNDILGLLEIDYVSIALLTPKNELLFFSSKPHIEWMLIEEQLWRIDERFQPSFFDQEVSMIWELYRPSEFNFGVSISSNFDEFKVIYTFGIKSKDQKIHNRIMQNHAMLIRIGRFSLKKILSEVQVLDKEKKSFSEKPKLRLIINEKLMNNELSSRIT